MEDATERLVYTRDASRRIDEEAAATYGIPGIVLMENAARGVAAIAHRMVARAGRPARILLVCGTGNNGGDGWAAARHLTTLGHRCRIAAVGAPRPGSDAETNAEISTRMEIPSVTGGPTGFSDADLVIDALFGTGLDRDVTGLAKEWIEAINGCSRPVLAVDVPSGLDADLGRPLGHAVRADRTATFVGWKAGFVEESARAWTGGIEIVGIGIPDVLKRRHGRPRRM
tara:strand:- start:13396 stop:14079 length:684 start_codon:yes stop_codon:yes gene_type:complete